MEKFEKVFSRIVFAGVLYILAWLPGWSLADSLAQFYPNHWLTKFLSLIFFHK